MTTSETIPATLAGFTHLFVPPTAGPHAGRVLLLLHGTGGDERSLVSLGQSLAPGAALLSPRGQVLERGSVPRFFRRLAEGVFDEADLCARTAGLAEFVRAAAGEYGFDASRVTAVGFSNGANIAAATLLLSPGTLAGAALLRAMVPLEPATLPDLRGAPVLIASGRFDPIVPAANADRLAELLRGANAQVTHHWEASGHEFSAGDFAATQSWLGGAVHG